MRKPTRGIKDALDVYFDKRVPHPVEATTGIVQSVNNARAMVRVSGASNAQEARISKGADPQPGNTVFLIRTTGERLWTVAVSVATADGERSTGGDTEETIVVTPSNVRAGPAIPGCVSVIWDAPIRSVVTFEVQTTTTMTIEPTASELTTRGSYAILSSTVTLYVRVRAISTKNKRSGWSPWVKIVPTSSVPSFDSILTSNGQVVTCNGNVLSYTP